MRRAVLLLVLWCVAAAGAAKQPKFSARRDYGNSFGGVSAEGFVAVADVNRDGIPDIVGAYTSIITLLGNGNGTFRAGPASPGTGGYYYNIVSVDLNGDGEVDLIAGTSTSGISVHFSNGDGTFQVPITYAIGDSGFAVVGDFNGDGIPDAVLGGAQGIWMFIGKGGGVFNPGVLTPIPNSNAGSGGGEFFSNVVAADFNRDGKLDLALAVGGAKPGFVVLLGNGDGTFRAPVTYHTSGTPSWLAAGDLTGNGYVDLVVGSAVYLNNGRGGFGPPIAGDLPGPRFAIGDVNGDGIPDLVGVYGGLALGLGNGQFAAQVVYAVANEVGTSSNVVTADLRKKGLTDLVFGEFSNVSVLLNEGKGTFVDGVTTALSNSPGNCGAAADFNGDGITDLAVPTTVGIAVLLGTGKGGAPYTTGTTIPLSDPGCPIAGDVNGDGIPDILEGAGSLGGVGVYLGNGDGTFTLASVIPFGIANNLVLGDFNHDGKSDVATSSNQFAVGNGDGTFQSPLPIVTNPPPNGFGWIAAGDMNNDGWPDIVATEADPQTAMYVLLNNRQGGFTLSTTVTYDGGIYSVMLADLNNDGNLDAVVQTSLFANIYLGDGKGKLTPGEADIPYPGPDDLPVQIGDVNGDGIPDLILPADASIGIALGKGDGTFLAPFGVGAGPGLGQILFGDQHGQSATSGFPDLIAPAGSEVWVLLNLTK